MPQSDNHDYELPDRGEPNWDVPLNENFERLDTDVELRDSAGNRGDYTSKDGARFLATDTGVVSLGDGPNWLPSLALFRYAGPTGSGNAGNFVAGHPSNSVADGVSGATIAGGGPASRSDPTNTSHAVYDDYGTIGGGAGNEIGSNSTGALPAPYATVSGGVNNTASAYDATVCGGSENVASNSGATVCGGDENQSDGRTATICGGSDNLSSGRNAMVGAGTHNEATGNNATIGGGINNHATAPTATIPGGSNNTADGEVSFATGFAANVDGNDGAVVFGDSSVQQVTATAPDQFVVQAGGGVRLFTHSDTSIDVGAELPAGSGSWTSLSARSSKANIEPVDPAAALEGVCDLDVATWNYRSQDETVRHMGPVAEEFHDAFCLGEDRERIATVDTDGVLFAAVQGLTERVDERDERIEAIEASVEEKDERIESLEAAVAERDETIARHRKEIDSLEADLASISAHVQVLTDRIGGP